ncbi:response regulator [Chrysiogenes arsenatis]|uniref:response regulator n=1 Tax=Chrysiogenes arsenatis TaxID=309797 RepID=UPI0004173488|nr:response regulator [Chrysiogenes arsenatis]
MRTFDTSHQPDFSGSVEIANGIYWVGEYLPGDPFQCHPYLIVNGTHSILVDPGSVLEREALLRKVQQLVPLDHIQFIILHHQDPDLCSLVPELETLIGREDLHIITHSRMTVLLKHYGIRSPYYCIDKEGFGINAGGLELTFHTTPYCHSPGAFVSYATREKVLFSSDLFGGADISWSFYADETYFEKIVSFHSAYMPSRDILNYSLRKIEALDIDLIAPQHGSIIRRPLIAPLITRMKGMECGLYIEEKYSAELLDMVEKLREQTDELNRTKRQLEHHQLQLEGIVEQKTRDLQRLNENLEERVRQKTDALEQANSVLLADQRQLTMFSRYLSSLNSVDVAYLAGKAIKQLVELTAAQLGIFYIWEEGRLKALNRHAYDKQVLQHALFEPSGRGLPLQALEAGRPLSIEGIDPAAFPVIDTGLMPLTMRHIHAIPLIFQESRLGVILLASVGALRDQEYLDGYMSALTHSLNNAMNYAIVQRQSMKLEETNMQLREADRMKSEFLANMSHELRTPLNSIIGFSNILGKNRQGHLDAKELSQMEKINRNGHHLLNLINDILDLSKIEAGKMEVHLATLDPELMMQQTLDMVASQANAKGITLSINNQLPKGTTIVTDEHKLRQILLNLVGNAVKFVEPGHGKTVCHISRNTEGYILMTIEDNGIGIPAEKHETIFQPFRQGDGSTTRRYGGTGLGLTISRNLAELLGGTIRVASEVGRGSRFTVALPTAPTHVDGETKQSSLPQEHVSRETTISHDDFRVDSVLIIDDTEDSRELIRDYLQEFSLTIFTAETGEKGLKMARELRPSLITLDIMMPGLNGWEVLRRLKKDPETAAIPVVVVSNIADNSRGQALGALDCLSKPLSREDILRSFGRYIQGSFGSVLIVDDEKEMRELMVDMLSAQSEDIRQAASGTEALAILAGGFMPDVIYLDLMMPEMNGFDFLIRLRADARFLTLPVVVVTAKDLTRNDLEVLGLAGARVLQKGPAAENLIKQFARNYLARKKE